MAAHACAQDVVAPAVDPYDDLEAAMDETMGTEQMFNRFYQKYMAEFRQDPRMQSFERDSPGVIADVGRAMRPWIKKHSERLQKRFRPQFMEMLHQAYTPEEAIKLAAFYRTKEGKERLTRIALADDISFLKPKPPSAEQPVSPPKSFLTPATGHNPTPRAAAPAAPPPPPDPAVVVYRNDPDLRQKEYVYFNSYAVLSRRIAALGPDKDIWDGMIADMDYAASGHGVRAYNRPLN